MANTKNKAVDKKKTAAKKTSTKKTDKEKKGVFKTIGDVAATSAAYAGDFIAPVVGFVGKSILVVLAGILAINALVAAGITALYAVILIAAAAWGIAKLFMNWREKGEDSIVVTGYRSAKEAVNDTTSAAKNVFSLAA